MLTYHTLSEFFAAADAAHCAPGELACRQEAEESGKSFEDVWERMKDMIPISGSRSRKDCPIRRSLRAASSEAMPIAFSKARCTSSLRSVSVRRHMPLR